MAREAQKSRTHIHTTKIQSHEQSINHDTTSATVDRLFVKEEEFGGRFGTLFFAYNEHIITSFFDEERFEVASERELNGGSVDNTDNVSGSGGLEDGEERSLGTVFGVDFHDLLDVVRTLKEFDTGVQWTSVGLQQDLDGGDRRSERHGENGSSLHGAGSGHLGELVGEVFDTAILDVGLNSGSDRVFHGGSVADGNGVLGSRGGDDSAEGAQVTVLKVDSHLLWGVVGSLPELNVGVERTSLSLEVDLNRVDGRGGERPGSETSSLDLDGGEGFPDILCKGHFSSTFFRSVNSRGTDTNSGLVLRGEESSVDAVGLRGRKGGGRASKGNQCNSKELHCIFAEFKLMTM